MTNVMELLNSAKPLRDKVQIVWVQQNMPCTWPHILRGDAPDMSYMIHQLTLAHYVTDNAGNRYETVYEAMKACQEHYDNFYYERFRHDKGV